MTFEEMISLPCLKVTGEPHVLVPEDFYNDVRLPRTPHKGKPIINNVADGNILYLHVACRCKGEKRHRETLCKIRHDFKFVDALWICSRVSAVGKTK